MRGEWWGRRRGQRKPRHAILVFPNAEEYIYVVLMFTRIQICSISMIARIDA